MMMTRKVLLAGTMIIALMMLFPGVAFANFAIHGGYLQDTDACAGCHRAHTSISSITWQDPYANTHSALLVSSATRMEFFCYACHGADAQGADTNVREGIYEGSLYGTNGGILNGGGFSTVGTSPITTTHLVDGTPWGAYGGGLRGAGTSVNGYDPTPGATGNWLNQGKSIENIFMDCVSCHDPHGSSNYRILKDQVYGNRVGGYYNDGSGSNASLNPTPTPWVTSVETGYPDAGWLLHAPGAAQVANYTPNYTSGLYSRGETQTGADINNVPGTRKGMVGWCVGCHAVYNTKASTYNAGDMAPGDPAWTEYTLRHRHPMNVPLSNFAGQRALEVTDNPLPLAHNNDVEEGASVENTAGDWIDCLTCHRAHGTSVTMTGFADSISNYTPSANSNPGTGTPPTNGTALLRANNRYVCEVCHNK